MVPTFAKKRLLSIVTEKRKEKRNETGKTRQRRRPKKPEIS